MKATTRWGAAVVVCAVVGVGLGVVIAALAGLGTGSRLAIGVGVGLIIGGGLLAILDRVVVRRVDASTPAFDPETGHPVRPPRSVFVSLSLEVWTLILVGCGILLVGVGVVLYLAG